MSGWAIWAIANWSTGAIGALWAGLDCWVQRDRDLKREAARASLAFLAFGGFVLAACAVPYGLWHLVRAALPDRSNRLQLPRAKVIE